MKNEKKGNGLWNMKQRAKELNGQFDINTSYNNGTSIFVKIPLKSV
jgi:signal transduction histidine kinase